MPGPNFISQAELDQIREEQRQIIQEIGTVGNIKRQSFASNGRGGYDRTLTTIGTNVPMRLWISSGPNGTSEESKFWGEQELSQTDAFVVLYWDQEASVRDIIEYDGREWRVVGIQADDAFITAKRLRVEAMRTSTDISNGG
jgi:hypothetical protein